MIDLEKIQQFIWEQCGSPVETYDYNFPNLKAPIEIGLAHVLVALNGTGKNCYAADADCIFEYYEKGETSNGDSASCVDYLAEWKLLRDDGTEAKLEDQPPKTQLAIAKLFGEKDE
jgi:hypothetical protein